MNDRYIDFGESSNFPEEAFEMVFNANGPVEYSDIWLREACRDDQLIAVREWFTDRYCDPAHETPYNGREGGYLFIHGGPYSPDDELNQRFQEVVPQDVIDEIISELENEVGDTWAPIRWDDEYDYYDDFDEHINNRFIPKLNLDSKLEEITKAFSISPAQEISNEIILNMSYSMLISYLEAYLSETMIYWAKRDDSVLFRIATKEFKDKNYKLSEIFDDIDKFKESILSHLTSNVVWHRIDRLKSTIEHGLKISLPDFGMIMGAILIRHDIVHRGGKKKDGEPLSISTQEFKDLKIKIEAFAEAIEKSLIVSFPISQSELGDEESPDF